MRAAARRALRRLANLGRWRTVDRDLHDEVAHHLAMAEAHYRAQGLSPERARQQAVHEFGGERWLEASRDARGVPWLHDLARDTRHALRTLGRLPGFTVAVVLVMALGVGSATAVYSVLRGVLLNPLPYADADALHTLLEGNEAGSVRLLSYPTFREVAEAGAGAVELSYVRGDNLLVRGSDGTLNLLAAYVSPNYFGVMGRDAQAGRVFGAPAARTAGAHGGDPSGAQEEYGPVAVLSARLASRMFGSARAALGETLTTADGAYTVIGVMPAGFAYPTWADLWLPLAALPPEGAFALEQRNLHVDSDVVVRLRPGVSPEQAGAQLAAPIAHAAAAYPEPNADFDRAVFTPLRDRVIGPNAPQRGLLTGIVLLVLVLAATNVAGLVLARGLSRRSELATRLALGAGRARLMRQLMTESLVLGVAGGAAGVLLAWHALAWLKRAAPPFLPRLEEIALDGGALLFAVAATLLSALAFGAVAALRATSGAAGDALRSATRSATGDRATVRLRAGLVVAQIAIAVVLLLGASLLVRTSREVARIDLGFEPAGLVALRVSPPEQYGDDAARLALYQQLRAELARVPGVEHVTLANHIPLTFAAMPTVVQTERVVGADDNTLALFRAVAWDYLATIGATAVQGRLYAAGDEHGTGVVVNETLARREWGDADPIGRAITVFRSAQGAAGFGEALPGHVIGVVRDIREQSPDQATPPAVYIPLERNVWTNIHVVVKSGRAPDTLIPALRAAVRAIDPDIATAGPGFFNEFRRLDEYFARMTESRRFSMALLTAFAGVALVLSLTGLFAVLAFMVAQRSREIGVRMALGARGGDAARLVIGQSAVLVCIGVAIGLAATIPATRLLEANLFGVERLDPISYAATCLLFLVTAALAAWLPVRRAARTDPSTVLREG